MSKFAAFRKSRENSLDDFFSLARISHDPQSYAENEMVVPVK